MSNNTDNKKLIARMILISLGDVVVAFLSLYVALVLRFNSWQIDQYNNDVLLFGIVFTAFIVISYSISGLYKSLWKFASVEELVKLIIASTISIALLFILNYILGHRLPLSVLPIALMIQVAFSGGIRFSYRILRVLKSVYQKGNSGNSDSRVIVIGGGYEAVAIIKSYTEGQNKGNIVALIDRYNNKGTIIHGIHIHGGLDQLESAIKQFNATDVIIASENFDENDVSFTLDVCSRAQCKLKKYTAVGELGGKNNIVAIDPTDLLGRPQVTLDKEEIGQLIKEKCVLVTGGGGSIGSELIKQLSKFKPERVVILDINENHAYLTKLEIESRNSNIKIDVEIGSIRDTDRMCCIFKKYRPQVVFHAAAHKHVPLMEKSPNEALKNNVVGTYIVADCAGKFNTDKFVLISTDKAVNPTSIMGASKRLAEIVISSMNKHYKTEYSAVRFGNVLGSSGSVIPIFKQQIEAGGPVLVTHPDITRFFMTIPEACQLVLQSGAMATGGEIFILDMQKPVKIKDLAESMIRLYGLIPNLDIMIEYVGLRPGEKLYEELMLDDEAIQTNHEKIFVAKTREYPIEFINAYMEKIHETIKKDESLNIVIQVLQELVPEFVPVDTEEINNTLLK
ncbi:MAG: polysaccharide biosynthesis protein [Clostridiales bacterium]|nr:polysaccharide biosynthesis protein [Clostridiales bacterium]